MNWEHLILETARAGGFRPELTEQVLNAFLDTVSTAMEREQMVFLRPDFGYFEMRPVTVRPGSRNEGRIRRTPIFQKSGALKRRLREAAPPARTPEEETASGRESV